MATLAITGASGLLGANLAALLLADGHKVVATRRASTKAGHLDDLAIEWRTAELARPAELAAAFAGCDAVFHCAASVSVQQRESAEMRATNVDGTRHVLEAVRQAKVRRLVHTSSVAAVGLSRDGQPSDETAPWSYEGFGAVDAYAKTKHEAEGLVLTAARAQTAPVDAVVVNPGYMFGPRDARPSSGKLLLDIARRKVPGHTPGTNTFVDARDVARGMIAAWRQGKTGERYILGGHELSYRALMELTAKLAGVAPPRLALPYPLARVVGLWGDLLERLGGEPVVNTVQVRFAYTRRFRFTSAKAERELGYRVGPLEDAIRDSLEWFRANGMLEARR